MDVPLVCAQSHGRAEGQRTPGLLPQPSRLLHDEPVVRPEMVKLRQSPVGVGLTTVLLVAGVSFWTFPPRIDPLALGVVSLAALTSSMATVRLKLSLAGTLLMAAVLVGFLLSAFTGAYYQESKFHKASFSHPLTRTSAFYFAVTTLTTTGYGDIVPTVDRTRLEVSIQQIAGLVAVGVLVSTVATAAARETGRVQRT